MKKGLASSKIICSFIFVQMLLIIINTEGTEIFLQSEKEGLEKAKSKYQIKIFPFFEYFFRLVINYHGYVLTSYCSTVL